MKKMGLFAVVILFMTACVSLNVIFPSGPVVEESRTVGEFEKVSVCSGIRLEVYNGPQEVLVESNENILPYVETYIRNNTLVIKPQNCVSFGGGTRITVYVTAELIRSIEASGGARVSIPGVLAADELSLSVSGGGQLSNGEYGEINCNSLKVDMSGGGKSDLYLTCGRLSVGSSGGGKVALEGSARDVKVDISGGGKLESASLKSATMRASMSGGGYAEVNVSDYLLAQLSGGAQLRYKGNPRIECQLSGGAKVLPAR